MADYTEQSVVITNQGTALGLEQIRGFFTQVLDSMPADAMANTKMLTQTIEDDIAFHTATDPAMPFVGETFVIRGGKIMVQTVGMYVPQ